MDTRLPFRGSHAVASRLVTRGRLAGPAFRSLGPDVYVDAAVPLTLRIRALGAALRVPDGVLGGYAAAELLGAPCASRDATVDLVVGRRRIRPAAGVVVHQDILADHEVVEVDSALVTRPLRTAYDLVRRLGHVDAVVALDALAHKWGFDPAELLDYPALRENPRGARNLAPVVEVADARSESPPETHLRLLIGGSDLPMPTPQYTVHDARGGFVARVDFAWSHLRICLEYQGDHHRTDRWQYVKDMRRAADLAAAGWLVLPVTSSDLYRHPEALLARIRNAIAQRLSEAAS